MRLARQHGPSFRRPEHGVRERLHEIDLLRFAAAAFVVYYHFTFFGSAAGLSPMPFDAMSVVSRYGGLGVNLFFIISGFVILMTAQNSTPMQFVVARAVRLYPAYWVCCTATYLGLLILPHPRFSVSFGQYLANLTMVSPIAGVDYVDGVYWSLLVELHFYVLVFLLLISGLIGRSRMLLGAWLVISLLDQYRLVEIGAINRLFFTDWSGYFIAGAMFFPVKQRRRWDWYSVVVLAASCLMVVRRALVVSADEARQLGVGMDPAILALILVSFFLVFALIASDLTVSIRSPRFVVLGGLTYPLYLLHQRLGYTALESLGRRADKYLLLGIVTSGAVAAGYAVHRYVERPIASRLRAVLASALARCVSGPGGRVPRALVL